MSIAGFFWKAGRVAGVPKPTEHTLEELKALERDSWSEKTFIAQTIAVASGLGWLTAHFRPAKTAKGWRTAVQGHGLGFPDLILVRGPLKIAWELKVKKNKPSPEQEAWLAALEMCGFETAVCYPKHWETMCKILES